MFECSWPLLPLPPERASRGAQDAPGRAITVGSRSYRAMQPLAPAASGRGQGRHSGPVPSAAWSSRG
jgi:hypothetical protein